jgi:hypothetical protein
LYNSTGLQLSNTQPATVSFWIKTASDWVWPTTSPWKLIFSDKSSGIGCGFYYNTERRFICSTATNQTFAVSNFYKADEWNHIVILYTGGTPIACYLNNHALTAKANNSWTATGCLAIGCRQNSGLKDYTAC